jgi:peptidoglycan/LPS O-acetylase OafA/YrhL
MRRSARAFPVQQLLATVGVHRLGYLPFLTASLATTAPVAAASWWLVEKPALRYKKASVRRRLAIDPAVPRAAQGDL